jgi:hypothetical protein
MKYADFFWRHEPFTSAKCSQCGIPLRRSRSVFLVLPSLVLALGVAIPSALHLSDAAALSKPAGILIAVGLFVAGVLLTNVLAYHFVGWVPKEAPAPSYNDDA